MNVRFSLISQRLRENIALLHLGLFLLAFLGFVSAVFGQRARAVRIFSQVHRTSRLQWLKRSVEWYIRANRDSATAGSARATQDISKTFGNRLLVLKAPGLDGEKGVLLVMFTEVIDLLYASMDLPRLLRDYTLVLEPSWSGYCSSEFLRLTKFTDEIFVLAAEHNDYSFLERLGSNLVPVDIGPCDWVDPRVAEPFLSPSKEFDIVMNSNWASWKRHYVLFRMLSGANRRYKVLLIGVPWQGRTIQDIENLANFYGVRDQLTILERVPYTQVMNLTCRSRVSILLSLKEGSNRALAEGMFCDVPVVLLSSHVGGIRKNVVPETGVFADETRLQAAIDGLLKSELHPRNWALENISCFKSSEAVNALLKKHALEKGRPWTSDIAGRSSSPESKYIVEEDNRRFHPWNEGLRQYLKKS